MATNGEMFQFISNFGPMLGQLAAQVDYLDQRVAALEGGAHQGAPAPATAGGEPETDGGVIEFMGQKIDMGAILQGGMPAGGMAGMMAKMTSWKPPAAPAATASAPPPAAPAPVNPVV